MDRLKTTRRIANLRQGRNDWYRIKNSAGSGDPTLVHIYDEIGYFGVSAQDFVNDLLNVSGDIELHINSPGGDVFDGLAIYNTLRQRDGLVAVIVDGLAASAASFIVQAADPEKLLVARTAQMMIHDGYGLAIGNAADMRELADRLDQASDNIASIYAERTGQPTEHWRELMQAETWYTGPEAVDAGLADFILGQEPADAGPGNTWDLSVFARSRTQVSNDGSYDDTPWDGPAAMSGCSSAADYKAICAGEHNKGKPDERQHWALPHHKHPGDPPNKNGTNNALSQLPKTQDLKNRQAAEDHLKNHQSAWGGGDSGDSGSSDEIEFDPQMFLSLLEEASQ